MKYIHLLSLQALPNEPVIIVSEFDDSGIENRRVEIWRSGRISWAGDEGSSGDTAAGTYQFIQMDQFDDEPYLAVEITKEEFDTHWALALKSRAQ